ncbi:MAG: PstS family phosphate ABC transporter substrate-binding protein [Desulfovibrionaceae bacterium]|nr:PstS family phosphate ABC transporter substrate-binding protein [Desulfovibrionaceae bacterium]MBF0514213.1 PstS family phosphate ABC transporter substrate-binding protein [Desulfovibrionaceae bacterium]
MKKLALITAVLVLALALPAMAETEIKIDGSTTVLPIMQKMVEAYMKENPAIKMTVSGGGSGNGIKAILDGTTDLAMSSRKMEEKELDMAKEKGAPAMPMAIAIDALVPIVNPANPVANLTIEQLRGIYTGKITNWKEVGGEDKQIVVISRDTSSGTYEAWSELVLNKEKVFPGALLQASSGAVKEVVSKNKFAIAYDGYGYVDKSVKAVSVNGIAGNPDTASNGTYPVSRNLFVITRGAPQGELAKFVDYIMNPAKGQKIVGENGAMPVKK